SARLADYGVDLLGVSYRNGRRPDLQRQPAPFAKAEKKAVGLKLLVIAVDGLYNGKVTVVVLVGRMFQKNPDMVWRMAEDLDVD
ncbi:hypothetical protein BKA70DRAFT_1041055, partial [Coprinopsis sp. MPI-PUGE-AT-0042]